MKKGRKVRSKMEVDPSNNQAIVDIIQESTEEEMEEDEDKEGEDKEKEDVDDNFVKKEEKKENEFSGQSRFVISCEVEI